MSNNSNWSEIGAEIRNAVTQSLQTGDFTRLGDCITDTVSGALDSAFGTGFSQTNKKREHTDADSTYRSTSYNPPPEETFTQKWIRENREQKRHAASLPAEQQPMKGKVVEVPFDNVGQVSGTLLEVFGGIGAFLGSVSMIAFKLVSFLSGFGLFDFFTRLAGFVFLGSVVMIFAGRGKHRRLDRARRYAKICGKNKCANIKDIAMYCGKSIKSVFRDIKKMISVGIFPQGHIDNEKTCLMLDDKVYNEYVQITRMREIAELSKKNMDADSALTKADVQQESSPAEDPELAQMIAQGRDCIKRLRLMNDNIPGEEISAKLVRLDGLLNDIFERLEDHPEQKSQMHKFMDYYLPMTLKLVGAYEEFDSLSVEGDDIKEAKAEIERTLDTINDAFGELLTRLFRDTAYDVTTDAQVLQTMLANEGLASDGFKPDFPDSGSENKGKSEKINTEGI